MPAEADLRLVSSLTDEELLAVGSLLAAVWPKPDKGPRERAAKLKSYADSYSGPNAQAPVSAIVWDGDSVIAHALTFARTIGTSSGDLTVLALGLVASDPQQRGQGLGAVVVGASFERVDCGDFAASLFQTSFKVQPFYERIGCERVENEIIDSSNDAAPDANPFWDDIVMRYPASTTWPNGPIDLRGAGY